MLIDDDSFRQFAGALEKVIETYGTETETEIQLLVKQCAQFQTLIAMETDFRELLIRCRAGPQVYRAFIAQICDTNGNILTLRPYFRERQVICIGPIAQAFKSRHVQSLYQYQFNFNFVAFAMKSRAWPENGKLAQLAKSIAKLRHEIVELNMPLAISQARIFWQKAPAKTQDTRFSFMDFVQTSADGLMSAVDKFVPPAEIVTNPAAIRVWRAVAIGFMRGNFIEMFSETNFHFFPRDKRKIYRANKHLKEFPDGIIDWAKLAQLVNDDLSESGIVTNAVELQALMGAATNTGDGVYAGPGTSKDESSTSSGLMDGISPLDRATATDDWQPDVRYERAEASHQLGLGLLRLGAMDQKLARMKGVHLPDPI